MVAEASKLQAVASVQPAQLKRLTRSVIDGGRSVEVAGGSIGTTSTAERLTRAVVDGGRSVEVAGGSIGTTSTAERLTRSVIDGGRSVEVASRSIGTTSTGQATHKIRRRWWQKRRSCKPSHRYNQHSSSDSQDPSSMVAEASKLQAALIGTTSTAERLTRAVIDGGRSVEVAGG